MLGRARIPAFRAGEKSLKIPGFDVGKRLQSASPIPGKISAFAQRAGWPVTRKALVYRFETESYGRKVSPRHMLGTVEAIRGLGALPILSSRREIDPGKLEGGFY